MMTEAMTVVLVSEAKNYISGNFSESIARMLYDKPVSNVTIHGLICPLLLQVSDFFSEDENLQLHEALEVFVTRVVNETSDFIESKSHCLLDYDLGKLLVIRFVKQACEPFDVDFEEIEYALA